MSTTDRELFPSLSTALRQGLDRTALSSSGTKKPVNDEDEVFRTLSRMLASLSVNFRVRARELTSLVDSTQMLSEENKVDEAIGLFERAIEARVAELGDNHIHTLELVSAFALFLSKHRRKKLLLRSKELYENLLKGYERELSWESVDTLKVAHDYARLLLKLGLLSQSKRLFIQILNYFEKIYLDTPHHPHILNTVNQMGSILKKEGNLRAARTMYERSWGGAEASPTMGAHHPTTKMYKNNLLNIDRSIAAQDELLKIAHDKKMARKHAEEVERQARMEALNSTKASQRK